MEGKGDPERNDDIPLACGDRAGTRCFLSPTMFIRQRDYQVSQCVYGKTGGGGKGRWRRLAVVLLFLNSFSPSFPLRVSYSLSFSSLVLPIYTLLPSVVDVSWALYFFLISHLSFLASHFSVTRHLPHPNRRHSSSSLPPPTLYFYKRRYLDQVVETDEEMKQNEPFLVSAAHRGGKSEGGAWEEGEGFILEHRLDGVGNDECTRTHTHVEVISR